MLIWIASIVLICKSLWIKASAKWLNVNANLEEEGIGIFLDSLNCQGVSLLYIDYVKTIYFNRIQ